MGYFQVQVGHARYCESFDRTAGLPQETSPLEAYET